MGGGGRAYIGFTKKPYLPEIRTHLYHICDTVPLSGFFKLGDAFTNLHRT